MPTDTEAPLLRLEEAREMMLAGVSPLESAWTGLLDAVGAVLAAPVDALVTLPPWDNSAMDGYAVRSADVTDASPSHPVRLPVIGEVAAGHAPSTVVAEGTAVRILTGAIVPTGADAIVPVEQTDAPSGVADRPGVVSIHRPAATGAHVRPAGGDVRSGERVMHPGELVTSARVALAAAVGHDGLVVHRRPRIAILATGDELVPAGQPLGPAGIHDSNSVALSAQCQEAGADVVCVAIARDDATDVRVKLADGIEKADVVVASGGVSVGAHDVVKEAMSAVGTLDLWRVAVQPGKPLAFGRTTSADGRPVLLFGLPGNPVSSFVTFELFVRPVLRRLAGHPDPFARPTVSARLTGPVAKSPERRAFLRVIVETDADRPDARLATLAGGQGSHILSALARADGLAIIPEGIEGLPAGSMVDVLLLERCA